MIETLNFTISWRMNHSNESNHQNGYLMYILSVFTKINLSCFGVTEYTQVEGQCEFQTMIVSCLEDAYVEANVPLMSNFDEESPVMADFPPYIQIPSFFTADEYSTFCR